MTENKKNYSNTPKNLDSFKGQFVVFFSEDESPEVLFHSFIAEEAYQKALEIKNEKSKEPVVIRVSEDNKANMAQLLAIHCF